MASRMLDLVASGLSAEKHEEIAFAAANEGRSGLSGIIFYCLLYCPYYKL